MTFHKAGGCTVKNHSLAALRASAALLAVVAPSLALAMGEAPGGVLSAPEFDAAAAGTVAAIIVSGAIVIARRRKQ